jgi:hypothetical protein
MTIKKTLIPFSYKQMQLRIRKMVVEFFQYRCGQNRIADKCCLYDKYFQFPELNCNIMFAQGVVQRGFEIGTFFALADD